MCCLRGVAEHAPVSAGLRCSHPVTHGEGVADRQSAVNDVVTCRPLSKIQVKRVWPEGCERKQRKKDWYR